MIRQFVLSDSQIEQIRSATERVLERTGVQVLHEEAVALCREAGAKVDEVSGRVRLPRELLRELAAQAPAEYKVTGVSGEEWTVGGGEQWGQAIVTDPWIIDYETQQPRRPRLADVRRNTIVGQQLERILGMSCMDFPAADAAGPASNLWALKEHLLHHAKHNFVYASSVEGMRRWLSIGRILADGRDLRGSGLLTVAVASVSPLTVTTPNIELLKIACQHAFPVIPTVCPTAGVTSPYTLAGTLVQGNAEALFLLALTQLFNPGNPFLYALGPAVGHMQTGVSLYYTLDKVLWKTAHGQLGRSYGLPVAAECGGAMVHRFDQQSGAEGMLFMLAAVAAGANLLAGFGSTFNAVGHSTEMMLIQEEYLRAAERLTAGIDTSPELLALDALDKAGPGGNFMTDDLTLKFLRGDEFFAPALFDYSGDPERGASLLERAHDRVEALTADFDSPVPHTIQERLRRFFHDEGGNHDETVTG